MFKRNCVVKYVDTFKVEHAAKVEPESPVRGCGPWSAPIGFKLLGRRRVFDRMSVTLEVHEEPTTHTVIVGKLKQWIKSHGRHRREEAKKEELRRLLYGTNK